MNGRSVERAALETLVGACADALAGANAAREVALPACRTVVQRSGSAIKAMHRLDRGAAERFVTEAEDALRTAQAALVPFPVVAHAGFLSDAEKEYVEARALAALLAGDDLPTATELEVGVPAWLKGLAEAASELRRHLLDRLRAGELERAEHLFAQMEDVYEALMVVDFPDAVTGGLRRTLDALRAVMERSRGDLTMTALQVRLQRAVEHGTARPTDATSG